MRHGRMRFGSPWLLLGLLLLVLVVLAYVYVGRRRNRYAVRFTNLDVLASVVESTSSWRRHVPLALFLLALTALLVGVARPNMMREVNQPVATVVLVIDTSGSMFAEDVRPTRLEAAQKVVRDFVLDLPERYRVGVVAFSGQAELVAPVTDDHAIAVESIDYLFPQRGTAIGDAIARAVQVGRAATATAPPGERAITIVLLSDGTQTEGLLGPLEGAQRARSFRIPVFTVALGTPEGVIVQNALGRDARHPRPARPDHAPPDRRRDEREVLRGRERRSPEGVLRAPGLTRQQDREAAGGDALLRRRRRRLPARGHARVGPRLPAAAVRRVLLAPALAARADRLQPRRRRDAGGRHHRHGDRHRDDGGGDRRVAGSRRVGRGHGRAGAALRRERPHDELRRRQRRGLRASCSTAAASSSRTTTSSRGRRA